MADQAKSEKKNFTSNKPLFSWTSPEFISYKKDTKWVIGAIGLVVVLCFILATQRLWTGVGLVVVAALIFLLFSNTKPKNIICAIYNEGVVVDGKVYHYDQFKAFCFVNGELTKIRLQMVGRLAGQVLMPLGEVDWDQVRLFLSKHLPEEPEQNEDITDSINRLFRL